MYPVIHFSLPSYAVMAVLAAFISVLFLYLRIEKYNLQFTDFLKMFAVCIIFGFVGSRVIFVFSRIPWLISNFSITNIFSTILGGGFVFYGGLLGVLFGVYIYCKKHLLDVVIIDNLIAPAIPLFHAIGRIGCLLSGCCYGISINSPITILGFITFNRVPTQIIEAVFEFILFIVIIIVQRKKKSINALTLYMLTYAGFRFIIEFFRGDIIRGFFFGFSTSQIISLGIITFYIVRKIKTSKIQVNAQR